MACKAVAIHYALLSLWISCSFAAAKSIMRRNDASSSLAPAHPQTCKNYVRPASTSLYEADDGTVAVEAPTAALYTVLVKTKDHYKKEDLVKDALAMFQSSREVGSTLPMHVMVANLDAKDKKRFADAGVVVEDYTHEIDNVKRWYKPLYNRKDARASGRYWVEENGLQARHDGWACYFKFFSWKAPFDSVLQVDVDFRFTENLDNLVYAAAKDGKHFLTCGEEAVTFKEYPEYSRQYHGFNTHAMILRPSHTTFNELTKKASSGDYVVRTNGEQDVIECFFPVEGSVSPWIPSKYEPLCKTGQHDIDTSSV